MEFQPTNGIEAMIKPANQVINAILGNADITDKELMTTIIKAEGFINSQPLIYQMDDSLDDIQLMPNHFLHGQTTEEVVMNPGVGASLLAQVA